jgi:hypothetical protein
MKKQQPTRKKEPPKRVPLFASPWVALFLLIRSEWLPPRSQ